MTRSRADLRRCWAGVNTVEDCCRQFRIAYLTDRRAPETVRAHDHASHYPDFRTRDARAAEAFYRDKLGFKTTWEHDPGEGYPVFLEIAQDDVAIHLSEHAGDGPDGVSVYVNVADARALYDAVTANGAETHGAPEQMEWGEVVFSLSDPDGNVLRFGSPE